MAEKKGIWVLRSTLPQKYKKRIRTVCSNQGVTISEWIRRIIQVELEKQEGIEPK